MDGGTKTFLILLTAGIMSSLIAIVTLLLNDSGGTKGITGEYKTKSGKIHTAKKSREQHIV